MFSPRCVPSQHISSFFQRFEAPRLLLIFQRATWAVALHQSPHTVWNVTTSIHQQAGVNRAHTNNTEANGPCNGRLMCRGLNMEGWLPMKTKSDALRWSRGSHESRDSFNTFGHFVSNWDKMYLQRLRTTVDLPRLHSLLYSLSGLPHTVSCPFMLTERLWLAFILPPQCVHKLWTWNRGPGWLAAVILIYAAVHSVEVRHESKSIKYSRCLDAFYRCWWYGATFRQHQEGIIRDLFGSVWAVKTGITEDLLQRDLVRFSRFLIMNKF